MSKIITAYIWEKEWVEYKYTLKVPDDYSVGTVTSQVENGIIEDCESTGRTDGADEMIIDKSNIRIYEH